MIPSAFRLAGLGLCLASTAAAAPVVSPLASRDFDIDLHVSGARGSPRIVGMGGTTTALAEGAGGLVGNPAAVALRPLSSPDRWDWDFHVDSFAPAVGLDFDNNGMPSSERLNASIGSVSLLGFFGAWGLGIGAESVTYTLTPAPTMAMPTPAEGQITSGVAHLVLARAFLAGAFALGAGLRVADFSLIEGEQSIFDVAGVSVEGGLTVSPPGSDWRWGLRVALPVRGDALDASCDPNDCRGYLLPRAAVAPWEVALGAAVRLAPTAWNSLHTGRYRDEGALILRRILLVVGPLARAAGFEAFLAHQLQRAGPSTTVSPRVGLEKEWLPRAAAPARGRLLGALALRGGRRPRPPHGWRRAAALRLPAVLRRAPGGARPGPRRRPPLREPRPLDWLLEVRDRAVARGDPQLQIQTRVSLGRSATSDLRTLPRRRCQTALRWEVPTSTAPTPRRRAAPAIEAPASWAMRQSGHGHDVGLAEELDPGGQHLLGLARGARLGREEQARDLVDEDAGRRPVSPQPRTRASRLLEQAQVGRAHGHQRARAVHRPHVERLLDGEDLDGAPAGGRPRARPPRASRSPLPGPAQPARGGRRRPPPAPGRSPSRRRWSPPSCEPG